MSYVRKHKEVQAVKLQENLYDKRGKCISQKGEWLVVEGREQYYMTEREFNEEFEPKKEYSYPYPWYPITYTWPTTPTIDGIWTNSKTVLIDGSDCPPQEQWTMNNCTYVSKEV
jgi:hypothetical protein